MNDIKKSNLYNCLRSIAVFPTHGIDSKKRKSLYSGLEKIGFYVTHMDDIDGYFSEACSIINASHDLALELAEEYGIDKLHYFVMDSSKQTKREDWSKDVNGGWHCIYNTEANRSYYSIEQLQKLQNEPSLYGLIQRSTYNWLTRIIDLDDSSLEKVNEITKKLVNDTKDISSHKKQVKELQLLMN